MKSINSRNARAKWRELLVEVQAKNQSIIIERYGKPIGVLIPYSHQNASPEPRDRNHIKEQETAYAVPGKEIEMPNRRQQLLNQLEMMPETLLETALQLVQFLQQAQQPGFNIVPVPGNQTSSWLGLPPSGNEGDPFEDSEAIYE